MRRDWHRILGLRRFFELFVHEGPLPPLPNTAAHTTAAAAAATATGGAAIAGMGNFGGFAAAETGGPGSWCRASLFECEHVLQVRA